jgi:hypothetical protein
MKLFIFDWFGSVSVISLLQLATKAGIPRQSEIRCNYQVASSFLRSLLILAIHILSANGTSKRRISDEDRVYSLLGHSKATAPQQQSLVR